MIFELVASIEKPTNLCAFF